MLSRDGWDVDVEGEEGASVAEVEMTADSDGEGDGEVETEGEVAGKGVMKADRLGGGMRGARGVEAEEAVEWGGFGHGCSYDGAVEDYCDNVELVSKGS